MSWLMPNFKRWSKDCVKEQMSIRKSWMTQWYLHLKEVLQLVSASRNSCAFVQFKTENNFVATENTVIINFLSIVCLSTGKHHFVPTEVNLSLFLYSKPESLGTMSLWMTSLKNLGKNQRQYLESSVSRSFLYFEITPRYLYSWRWTGNIWRNIYILWVDVSHFDMRSAM